MSESRDVKVLDLSESLRKAESFAKFGKPIEQADIAFLAGNGLQDATHRASNCMGWVWRQWLLNAPKSSIANKVESFVSRGLELREFSQSYDYLAYHDLYLLHCAIFAFNDAQLKTVAERVADASGDKGQTPMDNGELYAAAWCGMMKYWILGDDDKALQQATLIWNAQRKSGVMAAPKPLVTPWLKRDWSTCAKTQQKDFDKLWQRARKDGWTVKSENSTEVIVTTARYQIEHQWCWAHCGMALLAHRQGVAIVTDPLWLPPSAIAATANDSAAKANSNTKQLSLI